MKPKAVAGNYEFLNELSNRVLNGAGVTRNDAQYILSFHTQEDIVTLIAHANVLRNHFKGTRVNLCAVVNAKSGRCSEDCIFCAQSVYYKTDIKIYPLLDTNEIIKLAKVAKDSGADRLGIVTSGKGITGAKELEKICESIGEISKNSDLVPCASLGVLSHEQSRCLRDAGLKRYHHNLETAESYFSTNCWDTRSKISTFTST